MGSPDREARYEDDSREGHEIVIVLDDQGDACVSVLPVGHKIGPTVRLCASGGAASLAPGLLPAIRAAHKAIEQGRRFTEPCPWGHVVQLLADGELDGAEAEGARAHAAGCTTCARDLEDALQLGAIARSATESAPPAPAVPDVAPAPLTREQAITRCARAGAAACEEIGFPGYRGRDDDEEAGNVLTGNHHLTHQPFIRAVLAEARKHPVLADSPALRVAGEVPR